jgi:hypothetical protein
MSSVVISGDTSGAITLSAPAVAGTNTITLPASTGTVVTTGTPASGNVIQVVNLSYQTATTIASSTPADTGLTLAITPKFSTSKILVIVQQQVRFARSNNEQGHALTLLRGATTLVNQADRYGGWLYGAGLSSMEVALQVPLVYMDSPATTSATTYKIQGRVLTAANSGTATYQTESQISTITLMEIAV